MYTGDRAVQRPPPRRPDPDRDLQREARDRLRGECYLVAQLLYPCLMHSMNYLLNACY